MSLADPGDLGRRLTERRQELGLDRAVVAERAGMHPTYLQYLEEGPGAICSADALYRLANALETTPSHLAGVGLGRPIGGDPPPGGTAELEVLDEDTCKTLMRPGGVARFVFVDGGWPIALPVNIRILDDNVILHTGEGVIYTTAKQNAAVSIELDRLDETLGEGWSVLASGTASLVEAPEELARIEPLHIEPWAGGPRGHAVKVTIERRSGRRIRRRLPSEPPAGEG